jgi:hypothetical protein
MSALEKDLALAECLECGGPMSLSNLKDFCLCEGPLCAMELSTESRDGQHRSLVMHRTCVRPLKGFLGASCAECSYARRFGSWADAGFHPNVTDIPEDFMKYTEDELKEMVIGDRGYLIYPKQELITKEQFAELCTSLGEEIPDWEEYQREQSAILEKSLEDYANKLYQAKAEKTKQQTPGEGKASVQYDYIPNYRDE